MSLHDYFMYVVYLCSYIYIGVYGNKEQYRLQLHAHLYKFPYYPSNLNIWLGLSRLFITVIRSIQFYRNSKPHCPVFRPVFGSPRKGEESKG